MDMMKLRVNLMQAMYNEAADIKDEYMHKDLPIKEEVPFNIEYHIARYQVYRELLETLDKTTADRIDSECNATIAVMHDYIDDFICDIKSVKHGRWSYRDDYGKHVPCHCTNCGCRAHTETGDAGCQTLIDDILSKFCPNCGARMDGDEE